MATRVRKVDWTQTPLGPIDAWPRSLKYAVAICLRSPLPMAVYWGPELNCIYNDAERTVLGDLHPGALGLPARELLGSAWSIVEPRLQAVIEKGEGILLEDQPLTKDRRGRLETSYFTDSYSAILDDRDRVGGVLRVTDDTTKRVLATRRLDTVRELTLRSLDAPTPTRACVLASDALTSGDDVAFALIYLIDDTGRRASCVAAHGGQLSPEATRAAVALDAAPDELSSLFRTLAAARDRGMLVPAAPFLARGQRREMPDQAFAAVIGGGATDPVDGYLVAGIRGDLVFDEDYENFLEMAAAAIRCSVAGARSRDSRRREASGSRGSTGSATRASCGPSSTICAPLSVESRQRGMPSAGGWSVTCTTAHSSG